MIIPFFWSPHKSHENYTDLQYKLLYKLLYNRHKNDLFSNKTFQKSVLTIHNLKIYSVLSLNRLVFYLFMMFTSTSSQLVFFLCLFRKVYRYIRIVLRFSRNSRFTSAYFQSKILKIEKPFDKK